MTLSLFVLCSTPDRTKSTPDHDYFCPDRMRNGCIVFAEPHAPPLFISGRGWTPVCVGCERLADPAAANNA